MNTIQVELKLNDVLKRAFNKDIEDIGMTVEWKDDICSITGPDHKFFEAGRITSDYLTIREEE